jgi:hypothetical protein
MDHPYYSDCLDIIYMVPETLEPAEPDRTDTTDDRLFVTEENLVVRNYDDIRHRISIELHGSGGDVEFARDYTLAPGETVRVATPLDRAVYRVEARLEGASTVERDCLIGGGSTETALVEVGNGLVSIAEDTV